MSRIGLYIAAIVLIVHGIIELAPLVIRGHIKTQGSRGIPTFIFEPLQKNFKMVTILGEIFGLIRIIAAIGILLNLMWGFTLGIIISIVTYIILTLYLPMGIADAILSGIVLVSLLIAFFGNSPIT